MAKQPAAAALSLKIVWLQFWPLLVCLKEVSYGISPQKSKVFYLMNAGN